jgi:tetratricopeptide (TPR) repeat protein
MEKINIQLEDTVRGKSLLERLPSVIITALVFLLPVFFISSPYLSFAYSKVIILALALFLLIFLWIVSSFKDGNLLIPTNWLTVSLFLIPIVFLISALLSPNRTASLIGTGLEMGTFSFILLLSLLTFLTSTALRSKRQIFYVYTFFGLSFLILAVYEILRLFIGPNFLSFHYFTDIISNPLGKWNDLAVISGAATLLSLISLELLNLSRALKTILYIILVLGLFLLAVTNFTLVWSTPINIITLIGLFALIFFVYFISAGHNSSSTLNTGTNTSSHRHLPLPSLIVLVFAVIFTLAAAPLGNAIVSHFHINTLEVSPTWQSTVSVAKNTPNQKVALGVGPDLFSRAWNANKPDGVNSTDFWNTDFSYGVGIIPTFLITTGIIGLLVWLIYLIFFVYLGVKNLFRRGSDPFSLYLKISSFFIALYLWLVSILYVPGLVSFALAFIFSGLFIASLYREGLLRERAVSYVRDSRKGFAAILFLIIILIAAITWGYFISEKVLASVYANAAAAALNGNNIQAAETYDLRAINNDRNPAYYRFLAQIEINRLNQLLNQPGGSADAVRAQFQNVLNNAILAANTAISLDKTDYQNYLALGSVYETVIPLGLSGAADQATTNYQEALKRNPQNPGIYLALARVAAANKNFDKAKEYIIQALKLKNNYLDAVNLLYQIDLAEGNNQAAVNDLSAAAAISPNNPNVYFQLGVLDYTFGNYQTAAAALNQAITLVPNYADAKYYLGLSYYKLGRTADAISIFEDLAAKNPSNQAVATILVNLKAGKDPFSGTNSKK